MDSSVGKVMFCSISRRERILYCFNGGDSSLDSLARVCLSSAPPFHSHYFHSSSAATFSFLFHSDLIYFAIVSSNPSTNPSINPKILRLLRQIRDAFLLSPHSPSDHLLALIRSSEASMSRIPTDNAFSSSSSSSTKAPLLDRRGDDEEEEEEEEEEIASIDLESSSAAMADARLRKRRFAREAWWRHAKIVAAVDLVVCSVLFGIWMAVCRGFRCLS